MNNASKNTCVYVTSVSSENEVPEYIAYIAIFVSILFYGTYLFPLKKFKTGDGMCFQLFMCMGAWFIAFIINWFRGFPKFYALPLLSGLLWTTGCITYVLIVKSIGLTLGMLIMDGATFILGWLTGRLGLFGIKSKVPKVLWMNNVGVAFLVLSLLNYTFIKTEVIKTSMNNEVINYHPDTEANQERVVPSQRIRWLQRISPMKKRAMGVILSIFVGLLGGLTFVPLLYILDNYVGASDNPLDYIFSYYSGILATSMLYFILYCIIKKNQPIVFSNVVLPGFISGIMWAISNSCFLTACSGLSMQITFPIGYSGPSFIATLFGILLYKEIKGKKNLIILCTGLVCVATGTTFCGLSK